MDINRSELKGNAKNALRGRGGEMALTMLVFFALIIALSAIAWIPFIGVIAVFLIAPSLSLGVIMMMLNVARYKATNLSDIFNGFNYVLKAFGLMFMVGLFTYLWSLLLIVPGIIAACRYSMAFFIFADNPEIGVMDAINQSKEMTKGYKWSYFVLCLSFIGWEILASFTFGLLYFWLAPYMYVTYCYFYMKIKGETNVIEPSVAPAVEPQVEPVVETTEQSAE